MTSGDRRMAEKAGVPQWEGRRLFAYVRRRALLSVTVVLAGATAVEWYVSYAGDSLYSTGIPVGPLNLTSDQGQLEFWWPLDHPWLTNRIGWAAEQPRPADTCRYRAAGFGFDPRSNVGGRSRRLVVPYFALFGVTWVPIAMVMLVRARPTGAGSSGLCPKCGYDLRATPGRCPECGSDQATPRTAGHDGSVRR